MLLNKIVDHGLCFGLQVDHAKRTRTIQKHFACELAHIRFPVVVRYNDEARDLLQFTHSLERTSPPRGAVFARGVCDATRGRVVHLTGTPAARSKDSRHRLRRGPADHSLLDCTSRFGSDADRVVTEK